MEAVANKTLTEVFVPGQMTLGVVRASHRKPVEGGVAALPPLKASKIQAAPSRTPHQRKVAQMNPMVADLTTKRYFPQRREVEEGQY